MSTMNVRLNVLVPDGPGIRFQCVNCKKIFCRGTALIECYISGTFWGFLKADPSPTCSGCGEVRACPKVFGSSAEAQLEVDALVLRISHSGTVGIELINLGLSDFQDPSKN